MSEVTSYMYQYALSLWFEALCALAGTCIECLHADAQCVCTRMSLFSDSVQMFKHLGSRICEYIQMFKLLGSAM